MASQQPHANQFEPVERAIECKAIITMSHPIECLVPNCESVLSVEGAFCGEHLEAYLDFRKLASPEVRATQRAHLNSRVGRYEIQMKIGAAPQETTVPATAAELHDENGDHVDVSSHQPPSEAAGSSASAVDTRAAVSEPKANQASKAVPLLVGASILVGLASVFAGGKVASLVASALKNDAQFTAEYRGQREKLAEIVQDEKAVTEELTEADKLGNTRVRAFAANRHKEKSFAWLAGLHDYKRYYDDNKGRIESLHLEAGATSRDVSVSAEEDIEKTSALIDRGHYSAELPPLPVAVDAARLAIRMDLARPEVVINGHALVAGDSMASVDPVISSLFGMGDFRQATVEQSNHTWVDYGGLFRVRLNKANVTAYSYEVNMRDAVTVTIIGPVGAFDVTSKSSREDIVRLLGARTEKNHRHPQRYVRYRLPNKAHTVDFWFQEGADALETVSVWR